MDEISKRIKALRQQNGKTLKQLSEETGLSVSFLSQVERGESSLAITSLNKIAEALGEHITWFFDEPKNNDFKVIPESITPFTLERSNQKFTRASSDFDNRKLDSFLIEVFPGDRSETSSHEGEEQYFILEGTLDFYVDDKHYVVHAGEIMHYPSHLIHYYINNSDQSTKMLCIITPKLF